MKNTILFLLLALYISACSTKQTSKEKNVETVPVLVEMNLKVEGMTCDHCEASIQKGVMTLSGIDSISANHEDSTAFVRFDTNKIKIDTIIGIIKARGYEVVKIAENSPVIPKKQ